jgi:rRNA maturation protein Nop10
LTLTINTVPGTSSVTHSSLAYREIIRVCREGKGYTETDGIPSDGERSYLYEPDAGRLVFDPSAPFSLVSDETSPLDRSERVFVIYKTW